MAASGIENDFNAKELAGGASSLAMGEGPWLLTQACLQDQSDGYAEFAWERQWLLHPSEKNLELKGNLFSVESMTSGEGRVYILEAPLPHARDGRAFDFRATPDGDGFKIELAQDAGWSVADYSGGDAGRIIALQAWQRSKRPKTRGHQVPKLLCNTWGDRSCDSQVQESFILLEIEAAKRLGADIVQIDDGWQKGRSSNSIEAKQKGGVWEGFWKADPQFWTPDPVRFPNGFEPLLAAARSAGVELGLWFAPDSWQELSNWRKDADCILGIHRETGIRHFKLDSINATTQTAMSRAISLINAIVRESDGEIVPDLDITAQIRPGYLGVPGAGPLFVENRYTDWRNYWPHQTLRALWTLARWIDPLRLRMEFLNNTRNKELYGKSPLAPTAYPPATLFAYVMLSNPLGWFEASSLPEEHFESVAPLVALWRSIREELFAGTIIPVGHAPDGVAWTGFTVLMPDRRSGYALLFRELNEEPSASFRLPGFTGAGVEVEWLAGDGSLSSKGSEVTAAIHKKLGFVFGRFRAGN